MEVAQADMELMPPSPSIRLPDVTDGHSLMVSYLYSKLQSNMWLGGGSDSRLTSRRTSFSSAEESRCRGVLLRCARDVYVYRPRNISADLLQAVQKLGIEVAFTMSTDTTKMVFSTLSEEASHITLQDGSQYQIVQSMADISNGLAGRVKRFQYTCLVRKEEVVLIWNDDVGMIMDHAQEVERNLLSLRLKMWGSAVPNLFSRPASVFSARSSIVQSNPRLTRYPVIKNEATEAANVVDDEENQKPNDESLGRPLAFTSAVATGLAAGFLATLLLGEALGTLIAECLLDGRWTRMALISIAPVMALLGLFFSISLFGSLFQIFGPITTIRTNSRFYSAIAPNIPKAIKQGFVPEHITIQMPVYKESLAGVIQPTITSLKAAISHYERKGGTASIFVNDDGMQYLPQDQAEERQTFYHKNGIGWVARPKHGDNGFIRAGKFKKASNMNYALNISNKTEDVMSDMVNQRLAQTGADTIPEHEEEELYNAALEKVIQDEGNFWASGNIRIGKYLLIVDSDTRVPVDCLINGAAEMFLSPEVAIIQHSSGVMQVVNDYFENGVTFFTNLIYTAIRFSVGSGEVAPFVGHNAFLRWEAVQSVAKKDGERELFWSESHVSEDFDLALRLQVAGNIVRLATYHGDEFKEGVSLTVYDELARWEKYAYGCNELVFNPIYTWLWKGPVTPLFRQFLWSNIQLSSKLNIVGYISTYYAISTSLPLTTANYFLIGWISSELDHYYLESWKVLLSVLLVFTVLGNISLAVFRYRYGEKSLVKSLLENIKWIPMLCIFLGGLSFHLLLAIFAHMFSINKEWGATAKEATASNFFREVPKIFKKFKWMYLFTVPCLGGLIYLAIGAPPGWKIHQINAILPLAVNLTFHLILPIVLNPALMIFNY